MFFFLFFSIRTHFLLAAASPYFCCVGSVRFFSPHQSSPPAKRAPPTPAAAYDAEPAERKTAPEFSPRFSRQGSALMQMPESRRRAASFRAISDKYENNM